jgi:hypothetical protein
MYRQKYGAQMGRRNRLPLNHNETIKLRLEKMNMIDGDYDNGGVYWGGGTDKKMYAAYLWDRDIQVFVRGKNRHEAKAAVITYLPNAKFYR